MLGICFEEVRSVALAHVDDPTIESSRDAIVKVDLAGLCGSDLHPFFGREVGIDVGTVMGHEFVGTVVETGSDVRKVCQGDRVCAPFTTNCGECFYCRAGLTARCVEGQLFGWRQQSMGLHGGQSQLVRVPLADGTLLKIPDAVSSEDALLLGDNLSTGEYAAELAEVSPGNTYAVVGCGTVGLLAVMSSVARGANVVAIDPNPSRAALATRLGANAFTDADEAAEIIASQTDGRGADGVMELVGLPDAQSLAYRLLRPGGILSVIGCHCTPNFAFSPADAYDKNLTYRTGRCPARHQMSKLVDSLSRGQLDLSWCITHQFSIEQAVEAYDTFAYGKDGCIKAVVRF